MIEAGDPTTAPAAATGATPGTTPDPTGLGFRGDIDGLRAVAILLIVGYHVGLPLFPGGFIGVDVFFVISGFLISRNLLTESTSSGRVALLRFWARRIRRLVPALALMIAVVFGLAVLVLSSLQWQAVASQGRAAALYVSNIVFANQATDYFAEDVSSSLFLHTWSLGVEEQFYLVWPLLVAGAAAATARRRSLLRPTLIAIFATTLAVSLTLCVVLTARGSAHAFFGLPSRAWEFAAAGLLAALPLPRALGRRAVATASAVAGLALILGALLLFGADTDYPGAWPLIPVLGTLLVIVAGTASASPASASVAAPGSASGAGGELNPVSAVLATAPLRALGRVSYSWYLWHWPLILLAVAAFDSDSLWITSAAALVALGVGAVTFRLVENPVRFSRTLGRSLPRTYLMGAGVTAVVLVAAMGLTRYSDLELDEVASASPRMPSVSLADVRASKKDFSCPQDLKGANGGEYCLDGDLEGDRTIMVIGDSHANHWRPAFAQAARDHGARVVFRWRSLCPAFPIRTAAVDGSGEDFACQDFRTETDGLIDELRPDAIVTANSDDYQLLVLADSPTADDAERTVAWRRAYEEFARSMQDRGIALGTVVDTPRMPSDPLDCIAAKGIEACAAPSETARNTGKTYTDAERSVRADLGGIAELDINPVLCNDQVCPVVIGDTFVYTDVDHLYRDFVLTQVPAVDTFLDQLLG